MSVLRPHLCVTTEGAVTTPMARTAVHVLQDGNLHIVSTVGHYVARVLLSTGPSASDIYIFVKIKTKNLQNSLDSD